MSLNVDPEAEDHGQGFDLSDREDESNYGLKGIKDRLKPLDGTVEIDSRLGEGTTISAGLPHKTSTLPSRWSEAAGDQTGVCV